MNKEMEAGMNFARDTKKGDGALKYSLSDTRKLPANMPPKAQLLGTILYGTDHRSRASSQALVCQKCKHLQLRIVLLMRRLLSEQQRQVLLCCYDSHELVLTTWNEDA